MTDTTETIDFEKEEEAFINYCKGENTGSIAEWLESFASRVRTQARAETLEEVEQAIRCPDCYGYGYLTGGTTDEPEMEHCQRCYDTGIRCDTNAFSAVRALRKGGKEK